MTARFNSLHQTVAVLGSLMVTAALLFASTPIVPIA